MSQLSRNMRVRCVEDDVETQTRFVFSLPQERKNSKSNAIKGSIEHQFD